MSRSLFPVRCSGNKLGEVLASAQNKLWTNISKKIVSGYYCREGKDILRRALSTMIQSMTWQDLQDFLLFTNSKKYDSEENELYITDLTKEGNWKTDKQSREDQRGSNGNGVPMWLVMSFWYQFLKTQCYWRYGQSICAFFC